MFPKERSEVVHPGLREIRTFVVKHHLCSSELRCALKLVNDELSPEDLAKKPPTPYVYQLTDLVVKSVEDGMPLSEFKRMAKRWKRHDTAEEDFEEFVQGLQTSDWEKRTLRTIVRGCRYGHLYIKNVDANESHSVTIPHQHIKPTPRDVACGLFVFLEDLKGKKVRVSFEEEV